MSRNLIICCDGTGNEIKEKQSNVLKFYRLIKKDSSQLAFYDPGIGTITNNSPWIRIKNRCKAVVGLATGYGMDEKVLEAYRFLIRNYTKGDHIYLYGFSRGAYIVRVLAGLINMVGLLKSYNENLSEYALTAYKQASEQDDFAIAWRFQEVMTTQRITIRFMGCWDTVSSVLVPRPDRFFIPSFEKLPYTKRNSCVQTFRHAMAIDERRRMYRLLHWEEGQKFKTNPFQKDEKAKPQDIKQVWFSGVHCDIGGGYSEGESSPAKIPLRWMVEESEKHGIVFRKQMVSRLVNGSNPANCQRNYSSPCVNAELHDSMNLAWNILEWLPKPCKLKECKKRKSFLGFYLPFSEPRAIAANASIDPSVYERKYYSAQQPYKPINLPSEFLL